MSSRRRKFTTMPTQVTAPSQMIRDSTSIPSLTWAAIPGWLTATIWVTFIIACWTIVYVALIEVVLR